jgi:hypothetical protein
MTAFFFVLVAVAFGCVATEHFIPPLVFLENARVVLLPLVLFYGALALPIGRMLWLAFCCGLMRDCLTLQLIDVEIGANVSQAPEIGIGWSILLYAVMGAVMSGFRPMFQKGRWEVHCLMSGLCTGLIVLAEFLMISVRRAALFDAPMVFNASIWWRVGGAGLAAFVIAPVIFWVLNSLAALIGYNPRAAVPVEEKPEP